MSADDAAPRFCADEVVRPGNREHQRDEEGDKRSCIHDSDSSTLPLLSRLAHRYQQATERYGRQFSPSRVRRTGVGARRSLYARWTALTMPRSPTGSTSGRCRRNIRNISAVQRPMPFTLVSASMTSSSGSALERIEGQRPVQCTRAQVADVSKLLRADADRAKPIVGRRRDRRSRGAAIEQAPRSEPRSSLPLSSRAAAR